MRLAEANLSCQKEKKKMLAIYVKQIILKTAGALSNKNKNAKFYNNFLDIVTSLCNGLNLSNKKDDTHDTHESINLHGVFKNCK